MTNYRLQAERWMDENPLAYSLFVKFAKLMAGKRMRFGAQLIAERVRWESMFKYSGEYKINNNYVAYIARRLVADYPELKQWMTFRETCS